LFFPDDVSKGEVSATRFLVWTAWALRFSPAGRRESAQSGIRGFCVITKTFQLEEFA
jgi:hypothetical protein